LLTLAARAGRLDADAIAGLLRLHGGSLSEGDLQALLRTGNIRSIERLLGLFGALPPERFAGLYASVLALRHDLLQEAEIAGLRRLLRAAHAGVDEAAIQETIAALPRCDHRLSFLRVLAVADDDAVRELAQAGQLASLAEQAHVLGVAEARGLGPVQVAARNGFANSLAALDAFLARLPNPATRQLAFDALVMTEYIQLRVTVRPVATPPSPQEIQLVVARGTLDATSLNALGALQASGLTHAERLALLGGVRDLNAFLRFVSEEMSEGALGQWNQAGILRGVVESPHVMRMLRTRGGLEGFRNFVGRFPGTLAEAVATLDGIYATAEASRGGTAIGAADLNVFLRRLFEAQARGGNPPRPDILANLPTELAELLRVMEQLRYPTAPGATPGASAGVDYIRLRGDNVSPTGAALGLHVPDGVVVNAVDVAGAGVPGPDVLFRTDRGLVGREFRATEIPVAGGVGTTVETQLQHLANNLRNSVDDKAGGFQPGGTYETSPRGHGDPYYSREVWIEVRPSADGVDFPAMLRALSPAERTAFFEGVLNDATVDLAGPQIRTVFLDPLGNVLFDHVGGI
jgi:hypothetical protein